MSQSMEDVIGEARKSAGYDEETLSEVIYKLISRLDWLEKEIENIRKALTDLKMEESECQ